MRESRARAGAMDASAAPSDRREAMVNAASVTLPGDGRKAPPGAAVHMTERQLYAFRQQIAAYAHICQQLLQITTVSATQQTQRQRDVRMDVPGTSSVFSAPSAVGGGGPGVGSSNHAHVARPAGDHRYPGQRGEDKAARGPRWSGTPKQYEILEDLFLKGEQPPVRDRLTEITELLKEHGPIQEQNVHNWFQNRRSREKKRIAEEAAAMGQ